MKRATSLALLSLLIAGAAAARDLPHVDALAKAPTRAPRSTSPQERSILLGGKRIQYEERFGVPTFLWTAPSSPDEKKARASRKPTATDEARRIASKYASLYELDSSDISAAKVTWVHDTGTGGILVKLHEEVGGIEVFREELNVLMDRSYEPVALSGYLSGAARQIGTGLKFSLDERAAAAIVLADRTGEPTSAGDLVTLDGKQGAYGFVDKGTLGKAHESPLALLSQPLRFKQVYFHTPDGYLPAYYVEVQATLIEPEQVDDSLYGYVVSATDGQILFRNNMTADAGTSYSYRVWAETTGINQPFEGPQGHALPHPTGNNDGFVAPFIPPNLLTLANGPIPTNDPWLSPSAINTNGNNVDAFVDFNSPDGLNGADFRAPLSGPFAFDWTYDTTLAPNSTNQRNAAITQLFYNNNWLHDWFYGAGFDEVSRNAQKSNYGRGGLENDDIFAEAQDFASTNNANMATPADGGRPRMRMYVFSGPTNRFITVNTLPLPAGLITTYPANRTNVSTTFGPQSFDVTADLIRPTPIDGCSGDATWGLTAANGALLAGKIVLIDRGGAGGNCAGGFAQKTANAAHYGALGVIIANVAASGSPTIAPGMGGTTALPTVGALSLNLADGDAFRTAVGLGTVNVRLFRLTGVNRDGDLDNQVVEHEWGHYLSNRLIGNGSGLGNQQGGGMGEGWSDFVAQVLTVRATDASVPANATWNGVYTTGAYAAIALSSNSSYFGIRRVPYSTDMTKNPLTFRHIGNGNAIVPPFAGPCDFGCDGGSNNEVHNTGEVWATMLWESFASLLRDTQGATPRLTFDQARDRMRGYIVASYKLTPSNPTVLEARDAIIAAAYANDPVDALRFCAAFAKRGAGTRATGPDRFSTTNTPVTEDFTCSNNLSFVSATLAPFVNCDGDAYLDNFETWPVTVTLKNTGAGAMNATTAVVSSTNPALSFANGGALTFPPSAPGQTTTATIAASMNGAVGIQQYNIDIAYTDASIISVPATLTASVPVRGNADDVANSSASDNVEPISTAWTQGGSGGVWTRFLASTFNYAWNGADPDQTGDIYLVSPTLNVAATGNFTFTFKHRFAFEFSGSQYFDGGILEISTDGGGSWTKIADASLSPTYNHTLLAGGTNPINGTTAYSGTSAGYPAFATVTASLGAAYQGKAVKVRFRIGADINGSAAGWDIDDIAFSNITNTPFYTLAPQAFPPIAPAATPITGAASVIAGDADNDVDGQPGYTYSVPAINGGKYLWTVSAGGNVISGQNTNAVKVYFDASAGPFTVSVTYGTSCGETTVVKNVTKASTGFSWDFVGTGAAPGWSPYVGVWAQLGDGTYGDATSTATIPTYESASYEQSYGNLVYEAQIVATRPGEPTAANTLWVRGTPKGSGLTNLTWDTGYAFNISMTGKFSIFRVINGRAAPIQAWVAPVDTTINGSGVPNTLSVVASGGALTFLINGVPVKSITGEGIASGRVGLAMARSNGSYVNDKLRATYAFVTPGTPAAPPAVSPAQEAANAAANLAHPNPNPLFERDGR